MTGQADQASEKVEAHKNSELAAIGECKHQSRHDSCRHTARCLDHQEQFDLPQQ